MPRPIATNRRVDRDELLAFVRPRHHVILATNPRRRLRAGLAGDRGRRHGWSTRRLDLSPARQVANLRRRPDASACVLSDEWNGPWVQVAGTAEVLDLPDALEPLTEYYRSISGEHPDWDEYRGAMQQQGKCLVRITIDRWGPIATGGFPPELAGPD